jgi:dynein heavy chain
MSAPLLLLLVVVRRFYCDDALEVPQFPLSPLPTYFIPDGGSLQSFKDYVATLPTTDRWGGGGKPAALL